MKKFFVTFGDSRLKRSAGRIRRQAEAMGVYDRIVVANEYDLDSDFRERFKTRLIRGTRGFGCMCWKPQIILQVLDSMEEGDVLQYTDIGCHLNPQGLSRLHEYFQLVLQSPKGVLAFQHERFTIPFKVTGGRSVTELIECQWTKGDLLDYFGVRDRKDIMATQQILSGLIFIRKCAESMDFVRQWQAPCLQDFAYIDDSPSKTPNVDGFIEHRHDQSIFSILCKLNNIPTISAREVDGFYHKMDSHSTPAWDVAMRHYPVQARHDKDFGIIWLCRIKVRNFINRILHRFFPSRAIPMGRW